MRTCQDCEKVLTSHAQPIRCRPCNWKKYGIENSRKGGLTKKGTVSPKIYAEKNPNWKGGSPDWRGFAWKRQKRLARLRDGNCCVRCGADGKIKKLNIHHLKTRKETGGIWDNSLENLQTVCCSCHAKATGLGGRVNSSVVCRVCGKSFVAGAGNACICSRECRRVRERELRKAKGALPTGEPPATS